MFANRRYNDLDILISRWSIESHTIMAAWGEFGPNLDDSVVDDIVNIWGHQLNGGDFERE